MQEFIVPEYTPVPAAANGIVIYVKDDSTIGGPNPIYQKYTNFITIMHANEEYSRLKALGTSKLKGRSRSNRQRGTRDSQGWDDWIYTTSTPSLSRLYFYRLFG
jgi:murein DD-endopeptidase MepM/ murein hydrolase activator NlpD